MFTFCDCSLVTLPFLEISKSVYFYHTKIWYDSWLNLSTICRQPNNNKKSFSLQSWGEVWRVFAFWDYCCLSFIYLLDTSLLHERKPKISQMFERSNWILQIEGRVTPIFICRLFSHVGMLFSSWNLTLWCRIVGETFNLNLIWESHLLLCVELWLVW